MPGRRVCPCLYKVGVAETAKLLLSASQTMDAQTDLSKLEINVGELKILDKWFLSVYVDNLLNRHFPNSLTNATL